MKFKLNAVLFSMTLVLAARVEAVIWLPMPPEAYAFGARYPEAQRMLYAFDYGHALIYEKLINSQGRSFDPEKFEANVLAQIFKILKDPPTIKADESDIAPEYVFQMPLTVQVFDWSHMLHQFVLDVLARPGPRDQSLVNRVNEIFTEYKKNQAIAITDVCKTMMFMDGHYFSKEFRKQYPSLNLLIWSYHWFQIKLYEALMSDSQVARDQGIAQVLRDFAEIVGDLPDSADFDMMPETAIEAPTFAKAFPTIPAAFDNNHMLHDITGDILSARMPVNVRLDALRSARMALDPNAFVAPLCRQP